MSKQRTYFGERPASASLSAWIATSGSLLLALSFALRLIA